MSRDYRKEWEKEKETKITRLVKIDKDVFEKFKNKLNDNNKTFNGFVNEQIQEYLKNEEEIKMENMLKELKEELLNKEITLCEMDNIAERITKSTTSIFDAISDCLEQKSCGYAIDENKNIIVEFEIIEENEDKTEIIIKVVDIWED